MSRSLNDPYCLKSDKMFDCKTLPFFANQYLLQMNCPFHQQRDFSDRRGNSLFLSSLRTGSLARRGTRGKGCNGCVTLALPRPHEFAWSSLDYPAQRKGLFCSLIKCILLNEWLRDISLVPITWPSLPCLSVNDVSVCYLHFWETKTPIPLFNI